MQGAGRKSSRAARENAGPCYGGAGPFMTKPDQPGVPLGDYRGIAIGVRITCLGCMRHQDVDLETTIARLEARGVGGERTGVRAVAKFVNQPCLRCGGTRFETTPAFPAGPRHA